MSTMAVASAWLLQLGIFRGHHLAEVLSLGTQIRSEPLRIE